MAFPLERRFALERLPGSLGPGRWPLLAVILCAGATACSAPGTATGTSSWREGYSLLYELLSRDAHADKILWVKFESDTTESLMNEVVLLCAEGAEQIEKLAAADNRIVLDARPLPAAELETRAEIESATAAELLGSSGHEFEARLLITQLRALRYAANLARVLARHEDDATRKHVLERLSGRCDATREKIFEVILALLSGQRRPGLDESRTRS